MSIKSCKLCPIAIVAMGVFLGITLISSVGYAGSAAKLVPAEDRDLPQGSHIPDHRIKKVEKKVKALKAKIKAKESKQQQERLPQNESPKTTTPKE